MGQTRKTLMMSRKICKKSECSITIYTYFKIAADEEKKVLLKGDTTNNID
jgi:hypothetical protein